MILINKCGKFCIKKIIFEDMTIFLGGFYMQKYQEKMIFLEEELVVIHCVFLVNIITRKFDPSFWSVIGQSRYGLLPLYIWYLVHIISDMYLFGNGWKKNVLKYDVLGRKYALRELMLIWLPLFKRHKDLSLILRVSVRCCWRR